MAVLQVGRDEIISRLGNGLSGVQISGINIGEDGTAVSDGDTSLLTELDRQAGLTATQNGDQMELVTTFTNNTGTVREAGMYTDDTDDTQISRQVVDAVNLESSDSLEVTFQLQAQDV